MVRLAHEIGWWVAAWLLLAALVGAALVREAGIGLPGRLITALREGNSIFSGVVDSGRTLIAGLLLIFPGLLSDVMAIGLLLVPFRGPLAPSVASGGVIEGQFRRVEEPRGRS
ncbi:MAG: FxsA family protein [Burkholderiales bacterium]|nr:FxsA family protein [Burkholderiales bacterium]